MRYKTLSLLHKTQGYSIGVILHAVSAPIQPLIIKGYTMTYCRIFYGIEPKFKPLDAESITSGFIVSKKNLTNTLTIQHLVMCRDRGFVSEAFICDGIADCKGDYPADELNCVCNKSESMMDTNTRCKIVQVFGRRPMCSVLYNDTISGDCIKYIGSSIATGKPNWELTTASCDRDSPSIQAFKDDLVADCIPYDEDEPILKSILRNSIDYDCKNKDELPCRKGHSTCFKISEICKYRLHKGDLLIPCRTGAHLEDCNMFECNMMFKCPDYYCVPWAYVCDGKWDCPQGIDEALIYGCGQDRNCRSMFNCRNSKICIHLGNVCDEYIDCPLADDEYLCQLSLFRCPEKCTCLSLAIKCVNSSFPLDSLATYFPYVAISVLFSPALDQEVARLIPIFREARSIIFIGNNIHTICSYISIWKKLKVLDVSFNSIVNISTLCFHDLPQLSFIKLSNNAINLIQKYAFAAVPKLVYLDLSYNSLDKLEFQIFHQSISLQTLHLNGTDVKTVNVKIFQDIRLKYVTTLNYHICCIIPTSSTCHYTKRPWHTSCSNLLPKKSMRFTLLVFSLLLTLLNSLSIAFHLNLKQLTSFTSLTAAINANDIFCTVYTGIILFADFYFDGNFVAFENQWRRSPPCFTSICMALCFSLVGPCMLFILSLARLEVVIYPMTSRFKTTRFVTKCIAFCWIVFLLVSVNFVLLTKYFLEESPTGLCLPFIDPEHTFWAFKFITLLVAILQLVSSFSILAMSVKLIIILRAETKPNFQSTSTTGSSMSILLFI